MIRVSELKLPLDHAPEALPALIAPTLGIARTTSPRTPSTSAASMRARPIC
jgi:hypothetical protein